MGDQNSFYYFVIWLIKCNDFDSYEKTDNHFVSQNIMTNAMFWNILLDLY